MRFKLQTAITNVILPGGTKPANVAIYAVSFKNGVELGRRWLPDGTEVEDPHSQLEFDTTLHLPKNPLKVLIPGMEPVAHPDYHGEIFRLDDGELAVVFNHKSGKNLKRID